MQQWHHLTHLLSVRQQYHNCLFHANSCTQHHVQHQHGWPQESIVPEAYCIYQHYHTNTGFAIQVFRHWQWSVGDQHYPIIF